MSDEPVFLLRAPMGELPDLNQLEAARAWLAKQERPYRARRVLEASDGAEAVARILNAVRLSYPGTRWAQVHGGGVARRYVKHYGRPTTSLVTALGIHGARSLYVLTFERAMTNSKGDPPPTRLWELQRLEALPEVQEALRDVHQSLLSAVPGLEEAARGRPDLLFLGAERRGEVWFLMTGWDAITHVLVGGVLLELSGTYGSSVVREAASETLVRTLRENSALGALRPKEVHALLQGIPLSRHQRDTLIVALALEGLERA